MIDEEIDDADPEKETIEPEYVGHPRRWLILLIISIA